VEDGRCAAAPPPPAFLSRRGLLDARGALMLKNLTYAEVEDWCEHVGERRQRARQLWRWLYADGGLIRAIDEAAPGVANGFSSAFLCARSPGSVYAGCVRECVWLALAWAAFGSAAGPAGCRGGALVWAGLGWSRAGRQALLSHLPVQHAAVTGCFQTVRHLVQVVVGP
jgi:hypothetical protein